MIQKIKLRNWKSHTESEFSFTAGTNILVGPMGSGKTSILQAISFALFGTFSELKSKDLKIAEIISRNAKLDLAEVELELGDFIIRRKIESKKGTSEAVLRDKSGKLIAGTNPTQVTDYLKQFLKIDEDIFLKTVYAKQNEVDSFLKLPAGERRQKLDELMGLDKFDSARKNSTTLINKLHDKRKSREGLLQTFNFQQIESELSNLAIEIKKSKSEKETIAKLTEAAQSEKSQSELEIKRLRTQFDEFSRLEEHRNVLAGQLHELERKLAGAKLDKNLELVLRRIDEIKSELNEFSKSRQNLEESFRKTHSQSMSLEKEFGALDGKSIEIADELKKISELKKDLEQLELAGNIITLEKEIQAAKDKIKEDIMSRQAFAGEINVLQKHLEELEGVEAVCPVCSTKLEQTTKEALIKERMDKISVLKQKIGEFDKELKELEERQEKLEIIKEKQKTILDKIYAEDELHQKDKEVAAQIAEIRGQRSVLQQSEGDFSGQMVSIENGIRTLEHEQQDLLEQRRLYELKAQMSELAEEYNKIQLELEKKKIDPEKLKNLERKFEDAITKLQSLLSKEESLAELISEKEKRFSELEARRTQAKALADEVKLLETKVEFLVQFKNALLAAQETLRRELIIAVNEVMNNTWNQIYPYDKWTSVRLNVDENDYVLQLKDVDGNFVNVAGFASGGERMLACLSLRIAFAKVMAPNLNILILDEPTHNLDEKAISTFVDVLRDNQLGFLDQLFIVTHDEKLAEAGENVIRLK